MSTRRRSSRRRSLRRSSRQSFGSTLPRVGANISLKPPRYYESLKRKQAYPAKDMIRYTKRLNGVERLEFDENAGWTVESSMQWLRSQQKMLLIGFAVVGSAILWYVAPYLTPNQLLNVADAVESDAARDEITDAALHTTHSAMDHWYTQEGMILNFGLLTVGQISGVILTHATQGVTGIISLLKQYRDICILIGYYDLKLLAKIKINIIYPILSFLSTWSRIYMVLGSPVQ